MSVLTDIARGISESSANELALYLLRNVPGLPPIAQTIHILAIAAVMASVVFLALRVLGLAVPSQHPREMLRRLLPWTGWALGTLALSGLLFVLARPMRYFVNPVFGWKMAFLLSALTFSALMAKQLGKEVNEAGEEIVLSIGLKVLAAVALLAWVLTVLAGRWIAYAEYIFNPAF